MITPGTGNLTPATYSQTLDGISAEWMDLYVE